MTLEYAIQDALGRSTRPLKAAEIARLIKPSAGRAATPKAVLAALESLASAGVLHQISAGTTSKPQPLFSSCSLEASAMALLKSWVHASKKEQKAAKLQAKLPFGLQSSFESALAQLHAEGALFVMPGGKRLVYARKPRPSEMLGAAQRRALQKTLDAVNGARSQPLSWDALIQWLDEESPPPPAASSAIIPGEAELRVWYELDRIRSSTMMIPIPRTFARYRDWAAERGGVADCQVLRNLLEALYNNGLLLLEPCERPQDLPDNERALLVPMSLGPPGYSWCWVS
ncbi:hypothetical protein [Prosthecobacter sp.]|uniref:hypothetical protein n=1 Tax=Prosthecobacter sp. TaxID=1965333 RepID=UPI003784DCD4